jgi:hypothetical protein
MNYSNFERQNEISLLVNKINNVHAKIEKFEHILETSSLEKILDLGFESKKNLNEKIETLQKEKNLLLENKNLL